MKRLIPIALLAAALTGCATSPQTGTYGAVARPGEWQTVSVTNVPAGSPRHENYTSQPVPAGTGQTYSSSGQVVYESAPVYEPSPVYAPAYPVYPAPVYQQPSPSVSFSLGLLFGHGWVGTHWAPHRHYSSPRHHHHPRRHHRRR